MTTIRIVTADGTSASRIGSIYATEPGTSWRNSVDRCDGDGHGRVFIDCDSDVAAVHICAQLENDERIVLYLRQDATINWKESDENNKTSARRRFSQALRLLVGAASYNGRILHRSFRMD